MSKAKKKTAAIEMRREYDFDYSRSRPNRFASRMRGDVVAIVLEPDVARVFGTSESVNNALRSVILTISDRKRRTAARKLREKQPNKNTQPSRARS